MKAIENQGVVAKSLSPKYQYRQVQPNSTTQAGFLRIAPQGFETRRYGLNLLKNIESVQGMSLLSDEGAAVADNADAPRNAPPTFEFVQPNSRGEQERFVARGTRNSGEFVLQGQDGHRLTIKLGEIPRGDHEHALRRLSLFYARVPAHLRNDVALIEFQAEPDRRAAATYHHHEGRKIRFYRGLRNLTFDTFMHEWGHAVAHNQDDEEDNFIEAAWERKFGHEDRRSTVPEGWIEARERDGKRVSEYAETNWQEDFAESWMEYVSARLNGRGRLAAFRQEYPNTSAILDELWENRR